MNKNLDLLSAAVASSLRLWRGTWGDKPAKQPAKLLVLFDREDGAQCRLVREALTELNLEAMIYPCPQGGKRFAAQRSKALPSSTQAPVLHDPNSGASLAGARDIVPYLYERYLGESAPAGLQASLLNTLGAQLASVVRAPLGIAARPSLRPKKPLVLYSFESSPYSRPVRELMCALELPYHLINLGKLQWSDMGPAKPRIFAPGTYKPVAGSKRAAFQKEHGKVQVPYLIDPNTGEQMFESEDILAYLELMYAK
ncbi:MAG: glutathione S-transferase N-terminal domain-containing protein [Pseudomonadota bacterium]